MLINQIRITWGKVYNGPNTFERLVLLRELERMEKMVRLMTAIRDAENDDAKIG